MSEFIKELIKASARQSKQNYNNLIKKPIDYLKKNGIPNPVASLVKDAHQAARELKEEQDIEIISSVDDRLSPVVFIFYTKPSSP